MSKLGQGIVNFIVYRGKLIEKIFAVLFLISAICFPFVQINYDLSKYLPAEMPSKQGIDLMEKEFGYPGTARVMIDDVSLYEAKIYKDRIANIDGVDMVMWADSVIDLYQSELFINYEDIEDYYKDGTAIMDVTFVENDSAQSTRNALQEIENLLGEKGHFGGQAVQNKFLNEVIPQEMRYILVLGIAIILGILLLATNSWFEPFLFLFVIMVSVVINMGSNLIFGNISSITLSVAAVLQLAIAMDYTIILLDNFTRERKTGNTVEEALAVSIRKSLTPIFSAGSAAIVGFLALILMRYTIGKDIGLVLAKGIAISLITVIVLTPALILRWYKLIEKTEHRPLVPSFQKMVRVIYRWRLVIFTVLLLIAVPAYFAKDMTDFTFGNDAMGLSKGTTIYEDDQAMNAKFGRHNLLLAIVPNSSLVTERQLSRELEELTYVKSVTSLANKLPEGLPEDFLPRNITKQLHTDEYARILVPLKTANESRLAFQCVEEVTGIIEKYYPEGSYVVGVTPSTRDIKEVIVDDWTRIDKVSLLGVALAILVAFRSLLLPVVLMIPILMAVFVNMMMPYLMGERIMFMGYIIVSCLQLGATIDYSIIMTYRYLEFRNGKDKVTAALSAAEASILPILTSGLILAVAGYGVANFSSVAAIADLGGLIGRGALLSMFMVIALLPILFIWADRWIIAWSLGRWTNKIKKAEKTLKAQDV
ncbi:MAG: efflux RND transporter permease subunit [Peptococcia bacterium]|jgi:predicted RND superfamily exporter protein